MNYFQLQEVVFNHLWNKQQHDNNFTFSVRQVASKGAEKNHFIGTIKSKYFGFTCWDIPVYYPGSASDLTNFIIFVDGGKCYLKFQYIMTKSPSDAQSEADLDFGYRLSNNLKVAGIQLAENDPQNKMLYYHVDLNSDGYENESEFLEDFERLYASVSPVVDKTIEEVRQNHPDWQAGRYSKQKFDTLISKMHQRIQRFATASPEEIAKLPEESTSAEDSDQEEIIHPLNTILYGPPGTGKTYNTVLRAAEIIEKGTFENRYQDAKAAFIKHIGEQVEFVTFHQNYSYEDFVAGLRPDVDAASIGLRFVEHKGIFYKICEKARNNYKQYKSGQTYIEPSFEEVLEKFLEPLEIGDEIEVKTIARNVNFHITANNGKNLSFRKQSGGTGHRLSISTMKAMYEGRREYGMQGVGIYLWPVVEKLKEMARGMRQETGKVPLKNYVLIIDEINRANISKVFGELITLIEPDKRLGAKHELMLTLPGLPEDEKFSIPLNVYILGTMNTADKSIALLDIALRRRFVFEAMYPNLELVESPYKEFLRALNETILDKKGADFMIGHSYLMPDEISNTGFVNIMNQKIIPLLNEYFYNNRSISVFDLLKDITAKAGSYEVMVNPYKEVICQSKP